MFSLLALWRYTIVAQGEPPGRAALRVLVVQVLTWSVAFYLISRGYV